MSSDSSALSLVPDDTEVIASQEGIDFLNEGYMAYCNLKCGNFKCRVCYASIKKCP